MEDKQQLDDLMDRYLSGKMSDTEKEEFEKQQAGNSQLKADLELHAQIIDSIKAKNMKAVLKAKEESLKRSRLKRRNIVWGSSGTVAAAACLLLFIVVTGNSQYKNYGNLYYTELSITPSRSGDVIDSLMFASYEQIAAKEYAIAIENLDKALEVLHHNTFDILTEEGQYYQDMAKIKIDEAKWMKVIVYMKQGKKKKAKKLLVQIAESESIYSLEAKNTLAK